MLKFELDIGSIYYFIWSVIVVVLMLRLCELTERMTDSVQYLPQALRMSSRTADASLNPA